MQASLKIKEKYGQFVAYVKIENICDWKQVEFISKDYYGRATGKVSLFVTKEDAREAARKFAQSEINKSAK